MTIAGMALIDATLRKHAAARRPMQRWYAIAQEASWSNIIEVRKSLPATDAIKGTNLTCFDIGGNNYRLIAVASYERQEIVIRELLTHAEYDKKYLR